MGIDWNSLLISMAKLFAGLLTGLAVLVGVDVPDMPLPVPRPDGSTAAEPAPEDAVKPIPGKPSVGVPDIHIPQNPAWLRPAARLEQ